MEDYRLAIRRIGPIKVSSAQSDAADGWGNVA